MSDWQDISTAPKDRSDILVWAVSHVYLAWFEKGRWWICDDKPLHAPVTHWMPLPEPPAKS